MRKKLGKILEKVFEPIQTTRGTSQSGGFSLIEMMIVLAIIGLVMGLVGTKVFRQFEESKVSATKIQIRQIGTALDDFRRVCGFYPTTDQGLDALIKAPVGGRPCKNYDPEGFLASKKVPDDAWGNQFAYESDGVKYRITSYGRDGRPGGDGFDKEINSDDMD